jgi:hypothetical protein
MVGLIPLLASATLSSDILERLPRFKKRVAHFANDPARSGPQPAGYWFRQCGGTAIPAFLVVVICG